MSLGQLLAFAAFLGYLYPPIPHWSPGLTLTAATAGAERIQEILDTEPAVTEPAEPVRDWPVHGWVGFHGASFRYPGADRESLHDVTFTAGPGELVIVTGPSGAGKSTLSKLLTRFYDPTAGGALAWTASRCPTCPWNSCARTRALLPQETLILHGTIRENIECGRPGASQADIERAATDAVAHDFISVLPDGYDTEIAPGTATLSGGQLQRIALIARAMLRSAPVLVLDEPTAGLDSIAARRVVQPLRRLMAGRTTIVITHDLSLAPDADRILVVDGGRLVEAGTHDELLAWGGVYARLAAPGTRRTRRRGACSRAPARVGLAVRRGSSSFGAVAAGDGAGGPVHGEVREASRSSRRAHWFGCGPRRSRALTRARSSSAAKGFMR